MSGEVGHFEIPADNVDRARKFYTGAFGWKMTEIPQMEYTMVSTGPVDDKGMPSRPGFIGGGIGKRGGNLSAPVVTIVVDDITASEKTIEKHGGKILQKKQAIGDGAMGYTGYFRDSEGNVVGLYQAGIVPPYSVRMSELVPGSVVD
ncbi:MAG: VOC family protein [Thermoplasmata archaeon]|nr:VOC family protein [Thermoplasmata archaeon]